MRPAGAVPRGVRRAGLGADRGAAALEYAGVLPVALLVIFTAFQAYVGSTTIERVDNAARTGAREAGQRYDPGLCPLYAGRAMPGWLNEYTITGGHRAVHGADGVHCQVRAKLPLLWKGIPLDYTVTRSVTMPLG
ncbi:TadE family protein [Actinomadura violacea]|uniref:Pilus assembly protein n=1 Tax=Actinomadura violacea TaxID=2819934 RepID=A0ABS3S440_9ACTN|nr:TadE family protein [Actinomadura violacea]MBO2463768.1 pilus assembly protein [Actinomadura violacea]